MKAIINGKRYDTDKAEKIGSYDYGKRDGFHYLDTALYKTASGVFFLAGSGQKRDGDDMVSSGRIIAMTPEEARAWAKDHMSAAEIEAAFPDMVWTKDHLPEARRSSPKIEDA